MAFLCIIIQTNRFLMLEYLLIGLLILFVLCYIELVYRPKKRLLWYKNVYEGLGYKVLVHDFQLFKPGVFSDWLKQLKTHGDLWYSMKKEENTDYDILLATVITRVEIVLCNPQLIKNWLIPENVNKFVKHPFLTDNLIRLAGGPGLLLSQGDVWKKKRGPTSKILNHDFVKSNIPKICNICDEIFDKTQKSYQSKHPEAKDYIQAKVGHIFLQIYSNVILRIFFGSNIKNTQVDGQHISLFAIKLAADTNKQSESTLGYLLGRNFYHNLGLTAHERDIKRRIKLFKNCALQFIHERIKQVKQRGFTANSADLIQHLLMEQALQNKDKAIDEQFNPHQLVEDFATFLMAGTDTTTSMTKTMIYCLAKNPGPQQKLREQIDKYFKTQQDFTWSNLKNIEYIDWIQNQALRLAGPVNALIDRVAQQDIKILNLPVKKGDNVDYLSVSCHYSPKYYKNPTQFRPQRWQSECKNIHPFAFIGFSSGPRSCVGRSLALLMSKIALIKFMQRYKQIELNTDRIDYQITLVYEPMEYLMKLKK